MAYLKGIDVSAHQGAISWLQVAEHGAVSFAWIKATEGATHTDARFAENWGGSLFAGVKRGAYHFLRASSSARLQAERFLRVYPGDGELPPVLDFEPDPNGIVPAAGCALEWMRIVEREIGLLPMIYCSPSVADEHLGHEFCVHDLWIAHYGVVRPRVPLFWGEWRAWQTGVGSVAGVRGPVDLNVMRAW